jgi:DNA-binding response OmpR family regulator
MLDSPLNAHALVHHAPPAVLLVEAEPMLRQTMSKFLRRSGCRVTACPDGVAGASAISGGVIRPALIVLGARVLDAELAEVAHRLHELAPEAPVLGIADVVSHEDLEAAAPLPRGLRFLAPPFDFPDVFRAVRSCLRHAGFRLPDGEMLEA